MVSGENPYFAASISVQSERILYTPSSFARESLFHLQEVGSLKALRGHTSRREGLQSFLCFVVEDGTGDLTFEGKRYPLETGDVVFLDCRKPHALNCFRRQSSFLPFLGHPVTLLELIFLPYFTDLH